MHLLTRLFRLVLRVLGLYKPRVEGTGFDEFRNHCDVCARNVSHFEVPTRPYSRPTGIPDNDGYVIDLQSDSGGND